ncbi:MAG: bifunctional proline dehydrogenase/L-glutamate gamma-semialdehyde dehydrogenase [Actinobacteria bacterium]|nr:bifunctional proline dehydrogenase/L-glutamate gamma-semialdehyde dehydrogenase [Actinomycetota bacterium]
MAGTLDRDVTELARRIAELGAGERSRVFRMSWWSERMLEWAMARPEFKTQLFRFVDVFPAMQDDADVVRHLHEYLGGADGPKALGLGIDAADHVPFGKGASARVARRNISRMAEQFIVGTTPGEAVAGLHGLWKQGSAATVDLLGEKTIVGPDADRYADRVRVMLAALCDAAAGWAPDDHLERDDLGPIPRVNVSIKPTALASHYEPLTREEGLRRAGERLRPILRLARDRGATVNFDMEHYDVKDLTLRLFRQLLGEDEFADLDAGVVVQAYLRDSRDDLADLIAWSSRRAKPITVRLVKGAYWDTETVHARAAGWPVPVFERKAESDANYERCTRLLHDHHGEVRAAFASHNLRSLAYAITYARSLGIADSGFEIQMLYGMAEPVHAAIRRLGLRLRVYAPVGALVPGMAYLVRRLLENTSNESFVRHRFAEGKALDELIAPPGAVALPDPTAPIRPPPTDAASPRTYAPEPVREWRRPSARAAFAVAVERAGRADVVEVPALIGGERVRTARTIESPDPGDVERVVAGSASCTGSEADDAVAAAVAAAERWGATPASERAQVLFRAAEWMRARRDELAALQCFEAGKPWDQADGDLCEAVDFCEYYGREAIRLDAGGAVQSPPGEGNTLRYQPKGVGVVIAPWNFPLAIPMGMTAAALVAGNPVVLKPAEQTPGVAWQIVQALEAGGLPKGVLGFVPGLGEEVGARLVEHPDVAFVVFTGSREVGLAINQVAATPRSGQRLVKKVIAEMGGKNALIVDADADPDQAVPAAVYSAFGFAGQKCSALSRLIVLDAAYEAVVPRLVQAARELAVGHPRHMGTQVGPVIDADAYKRLRSVIDEAGRHGRVTLARDDVPTGGWYVGPAVAEEVDPASTLARDEHFGPVLSVFRVADLDEAIALANDTDYALTAGIFSRSPVNIERATRELRAGNLYVNRHITGAVVGRQPFGGFGLSGVGSKAGGPDYLLQLVDPRVVSENTLRQGFAPES